MEDGIEATEEGTLERGGSGSPQAPMDTLPSTEFVKVEKNLASLGFFTPSSNRLRNAQEKSFTITTVVDGQRVELKGTIIPSAKYGLPITADQDKWIALCKILTDILRKEGRVMNPVSFTSADILRLLHKHRHSGKNYREIEEWLDVLFSTTIFSEGVVYLAREKRRVKDRYRVFDRAVSFGKELEDGRRADKNYVWLSDWQLQNINSNHLLPIDIEAYRELKNHIAKALVPLLQVWLFASRDEGVYEKRYTELCEILNIRKYRYRSIIVQTLGPSLDELRQFGYLSDWRIEETSDGDGYKIVFHHGEKFHRDRQARLARKRISSNSPSPEQANTQHTPRFSREGRRLGPSSGQAEMLRTAVDPQIDPVLLNELTRRGINEDKARIVLASSKPGQDVLAQLEMTDELIKNAGVRIVNPPGFYIRQIERNALVPDNFETSVKRKAREDQERQEREHRARDEAQQQIESEYENYCDTEIDRYIEEHAAEFAALKDAQWKEDRERFTFATETTAKLQARYKISKQVPVLTLDEFIARKREGTDFSPKPTPPSQVEEIASDSHLPEDLFLADERREAEAARPGDALEPDSAIPPEAEPQAPGPIMLDLSSQPPRIEPGETTEQAA